DSVGLKLRFVVLIGLNTKLLNTHVACPLDGVALVAVLMELSECKVHVRLLSNDVLRLLFALWLAVTAAPTSCCGIIGFDSEISTRLLPERYGQTEDWSQVPQDDGSFQVPAFVVERCIRSVKHRPILVVRNELHCRNIGLCNLVLDIKCLLGRHLKTRELVIILCIQLVAVTVRVFEMPDY